MVYVRINVHLDDTIFDSKLDFIVGGTRSSVHNKEDGLGIVGSKLFLGIFLVLSKTSRLEGDITYKVKMKEKGMEIEGPRQNENSRRLTTQYDCMRARSL